MSDIVMTFSGEGDLPEFINKINKALKKYTRGRSKN